MGAVADVSRAAEVAAAVQLAVDSYGRLDVLYNNAGVWLATDGPVPDLDEETWDRIIAVNLKGTFLGCKYAIPHLRAAGGGSIINVSSVSALRAGKDLFDAYAASKGGIISLTYSVASTWGPQKIRANVICPGSIDTPMTAGSYADPKVREFWRTRTALGHVGAADDVAQTALWLASDESSYVTGAVIVVDGGYMTRVEMPSLSLQGKVAIVTGGGVGIGYGIAQRLAEEGAKVVIAQRRGERAEQAAAELTAQGATCLGLATDVTQRGRVQELVATAREWGGGSTFWSTTRASPAWSSSARSWS